MNKDNGYDFPPSKHPLREAVTATLIALVICVGFWWLVWKAFWWLIGAI
jgi:hypothetical protein